MLLKFLSDVRWCSPHRLALTRYFRLLCCAVSAVLLSCCSDACRHEAERHVEALCSYRQEGKADSIAALRCRLLDMEDGRVRRMMVEMCSDSSACVRGMVMACVMPVDAIAVFFINDPDRDVAAAVKSCYLSIGEEGAYRRLKKKICELENDLGLSRRAELYIFMASPEELGCAIDISTDEAVYNEIIRAYGDDTGSIDIFKQKIKKK